MKAVGKQCAGKPPALFDEEALGNVRALLYNRLIDCRPVPDIEGSISI